MIKIDYTALSIKLILLNGILLGFIIMQKSMDFNIFPYAIESFLLGLVACFEIYVVSFYLIAVVSELRKISSAMSKWNER